MFKLKFVLSYSVNTEVCKNHMFSKFSKSKHTLLVHMKKKNTLELPKTLSCSLHKGNHLQDFYTIN